MSDTIKLKRGNNAQFTSVALEAGEPAFVLDTKKLYVGDGTEKICINPDISKSDVGLSNVTNDLQLKASQLKTALSSTPSDSNILSEKVVSEMVDNISDLIPTNTSELTNDSGFLTEDSVLSIDGGTF